MLAKDLIKDVPVVMMDDDLGTARDKMDEICVCDLPVLYRDKLAGVLPGDVIIGTEDEKGTVEDLRDTFLNIFVNEDQHILDVFYVSGLQETTVIPVIDGKNNYKGSIKLHDLVREISNTYTFSRPGGIITLKMEARDYQLSEIARIVESNDAKILSILTSFTTDGSKVFVTLKVNQEDLKHITATFERFGYETTLYYEEHFRFNDLKERYEYLLKFMDI